MSDETKTAPAEMTWDGSQESRNHVLAFIGVNGGDARYEDWLPVDPLIAITAPSGWVYVAPGDTVVMGEWFWARVDGFSQERRLREFTVRPASGVSR